MKIAISAGHYKYTIGKRCAKQLDPNETREWVLNARIAEIMESLLQNYNDVEVVRLDDRTGEKPITIQQRAKTANNNKVDIYIAIHHNAGINLGAGGGTVVYHYPKEARKESATKLYNCVIAMTGLRGNRATPIKATDSLYEITAPNAPSFLIENGFMDSRVDVPIILTAEHAKKTALGIVNFLEAEYGIKKKTTAQKEEKVNPYLIPTRSLKYVAKNKMTGNDVKWLQFQLSLDGYNLEVDGIFGSLTDTAVRNFQKARAHKLTVDGIVGSATRGELLKI